MARARRAAHRSTAALAALLLCLSACASTTIIRTEPPGAEVYVDGRPVVHSPAVIARTAGFPSRLRVQLRREGYRDEELFIDSEMSPAAAVAGVLYGVSWLFAWGYDENYIFNLRPLEEPPPKE
jgi:hypothetical protein